MSVDLPSQCIAGTCRCPFMDIVDGEGMKRVYLHRIYAVTKVTPENIEASRSRPGDFVPVSG